MSVHLPWFSVLECAHIAMRCSTVCKQTIGVRVIRRRVVHVTPTHRFRCARCRRASAQLIETWSNFGAQVNQWGNVAKYGSVMVRLGRADWNVHSYSIKDSERIEWLRMDEARWWCARQASILRRYSKFERCVTVKSEPESVSLSFDCGPITPYSV